jgi:hypothetical protein
MASTLASTCTARTLFYFNSKITGGSSLPLMMMMGRRERVVYGFRIADVEISYSCILSYGIWKASLQILHLLSFSREKKD